MGLPGPTPPGPRPADGAELAAAVGRLAAFMEDGQLRWGEVEAVDGERVTLATGGRRVAIEVTELVDPKGIANYQAGRIGEWAVWSRDSFLAGITDRLAAKAKRTGALKDGPYPGGYAVVIFTDEPHLNQAAVNAYLKGQRFPAFDGLTMAFLLLGYDPAIKRCPWFRLRLAD